MDLSGSLQAVSAHGGRRGNRRIAVLAGALVVVLGQVVAGPQAEAAPLAFTDVNPNQADTDAADADRASGGRVNGLATVAGDNETFYAASEWGGLYKSTDGGLRWSHLPGHNPMVTWDVEVDPSDSSTVYATSLFDGRETGSLSGIEVSTNSGTTWAKPATADPPGVYNCSATRKDEPSAFGISIRPDATDTVFVGTNCGLARSTDGGATWTFIDPKANPAAGAPLPGSAQSIYDVVAQSSGVVDICGQEGHWRSTDNGNTWLRGSGLPNAGTGSGCSIAGSPDENYVLFAVVGTALFDLTDAQTDSDGNGVLDTAWATMGPNPSPQGRIPFFATNPRSGNGGRDFDIWFGDVSLHRRPCTTPMSPAVGGATRCPALAQGANGIDDDGNGDDLNNDNMITCPAECVDEPDESWIGRPGGLAGDQGNGNRAFTRLSGAHDDAGDLAFDSSVSVDACLEVFSSDGGVYYNTDNSADCHNPNWEQPNVTPHALWPFAMAGFSRAGDAAEDLYLGLQDNGTFANNNIGAAAPAASWHIDACCDGFDAVSDGNRVVRTRCCGFSIELCDTAYTACSGLGGANNPPGCCPQFRFPDFLATIGDKQYVAATSQGLFLTTDITAGAVVWNQIGASSSPGAGFCAVDVSFSGGTPTFYAWVGSCRPDDTNQIWSYTGTGAGTWARIDNNGLAGGFGIFASDPNDPNRLYASHLGGATPQMIFSTDGGTTWNPDPDLDAMMTQNGAFKMRTQRGPDNFVLEDTTGLPGYVQPSLVAFDPEDFNVIVAGGVDSGVFLSSNSGADWALLNNPNSTNNTVPHLPRPRFAYFDHEPAGQAQLYIGSQGRGVWRIALPFADLSVNKADAPDPVAAGTDLTYTITVENDGPDAAGNVTMTDPLPAGTTFQSITVPVGWSCDTPAVGTGGTVTCIRASFPNGGSSTFTIVVRVDPATPTGTILTDTATVFSNAIDDDQSDNSATAQTTVIRVADLEIVSFEAIDPPTEILIGDDVDITFRKVITNNGPSAPEDARLTITASASPGASVLPAASVIVEPALGLGQLREVEETFTVSCQEPSHHTFTFHNEIEPVDPLTTDPDLTNNEAEVVLDIECVVPVAINIKPGSDPNSIQVGRGTITVAMLTTSAGEYGTPIDFDATTIDPLSVRFGQREAVFAETGGAFERHGKGHIEDAFDLDETTKDGDLDMVLHFLAAESGLTATDTEACVKGSWTDGLGMVHKFFGCDSINVVPG